MRIVKHIPLFLLFFLISCVGTVQEAAIPENRQAAGQFTTFPYAGIQIARAVSHNRIEIEFAALGGPDYEYYLYINDSESPVKLDPNSLFNSTGGRLLYTLTDRATNREYKLKLTARNLKIGSRSTNENTVFVTTFDNQVADFGGVSKIELTPGSKTSSMDIHWIAPKLSNPLFLGDYDPVCYQITYISEEGGPANINNPSYNGNDRTTIYVPECYKTSAPELVTPFSHPTSKTISNLKPNTRYFVQVRAVNKRYYTYDIDPNIVEIPVSKDSNTKFLSIQTDPVTSDFYFDQDDLVLSNAKGMDAFDKIVAAWQPGIGLFNSYRIFYKKYTGSGSPYDDDELTEVNLISMNASNNYVSVPPEQTSRVISGLETNAFYQVKVALCKTLTCPVSSVDPNVAIISDLRVIQVVGRLASFTGINVIENPGQFSQNDLVNLKFDPPVITDGFATHLELYCVNPDNHNEMVKLPTNTPLAGSPIPICNGLYLDIPSPILDLSKYREQKVKGIIANGKTQYCFAGTPAIIGYTPEQRLPADERIVRCSYPEVKPPTLEQFPGISNTCNIDGRISSLTWNLPNGGIYSGFQVFWKEKVSGQIFSFADATGGSLNYSKSTVLTADVTNYDVTGLIPGKTYQFGVLAVTDLPAPTGTLYSEYNLNVLECTLPLPLATFKGFSRIFAIGPKIDGRIPNDPLTKAPPTSARLFEAINADGIPYEVPMASPEVPDAVPTYYQNPPGRDFLHFSAAFDGKRGDTGFALSRNGIISLAWEEVDFSHPDIKSLFVSEQPSANVDRSSRRWGYRVYRSHDNKLTWQQVTDQSGVIFSMPYQYYKRSNAEPVSTRMAFFTDYSVKALNEVHDATAGRDVDRARIYYYKIVPVFDGKELNFVGNTKHNIVQVTLPPPNMALVHRWMANRSHCHSMEKTVDIGDNYSCSFNGIGSVGQNVPFRTGFTKYDQSGDLLVDRFELGCKFTRGDLIDEPHLGLSHFERPGTRLGHPGDQSMFAQFQGYRTIGTLVDSTSPFKGCAGNNSFVADTTPVGYTASYNQFIHGDCTGASGLNLYHRACTQVDKDRGINGIVYNVPGLGASLNMLDCADVDPTRPNTKDTLIDNEENLRNFEMHSEFLAVFHNRFVMTSGTPRSGPVWGPVAGSPDAKQDLRVTHWSGTNTCAINLASIDSEGYMKPRWIDVNNLSGGRLTYKGSTDVNLLEKTVNEVIQVETDPTKPPTFFNGFQEDTTPPIADFRLPAANLRDQTNPRYRGTTQLGRMIASNSAKLPPIGSISQQVGDALCGTGWVQVGLANESNQFAATSTVKKKRLMRRTESITASTWPETYDDEKVELVEKNTAGAAGACLNTTRNNIGYGLTKGTYITNNNTLYAGSTSTISYVPLLTGSSPYNTYSTILESDHSQSCTSKYGVQDLVGNLSEMNSERIFCDYSGDQMYLGPVKSVWPGDKETREMGNGDPQIPFFNSSAERESWYVLYHDPTKAGQPDETFRIYFKSSPSDPENPATTLSAYPGYKVAPWVVRDTNSGYCSIVDSNSQTRVTGNNFTDPTGAWNNIFLPGGAVNTDIVGRPQPDQSAVTKLRNGDGHFLDFGPNSLLPAMNFPNTTSLTQGTGSDEEAMAVGQGKYFNPIVGFPIKCNNSSCDNPLLASPNDNRLLSTDGLKDNLAEIDPEPSINNFPIGNSQITNPGLSTYTMPAAGIEKLTVLEQNSAEPRTVLTSITLDPITGAETAPREKKTFPDDFAVGSEVELYRMVWDVDRGTIFMPVTGGHSREARTGRYTAAFQSATSNTWNTYYRGARCAIMVNEE